MTKIELLDVCEPIQILKAYVNPDVVNERYQEVLDLIRKNPTVPKSTINAVIIRTIASTQENSEANGYFNYPYLQRVLDTFKSNKINNTALAVKYLENKRNHKSSKKRAFEPEWLAEYEEMLK